MSRQLGHRLPNLTLRVHAQLQVLEARRVVSRRQETKKRLVGIYEDLLPRGDMPYEVRDYEIRSAQGESSPPRLKPELGSQWSPDKESHAERGEENEQVRH
jgi:hypothetical protein